MLETARLVVVAWVVVALTAVKFCKVVDPATRSEELTVEEASERKPLYKPITVEVACSPPACFVNGQGRPTAAVGHELLQSPERQKVVAARLVEVALVVVALVAMKVERVEDAVETKPLLNSRMVVVAFSPVPSLVKG